MSNTKSKTPFVENIYSKQKLKLELEAKSQQLINLEHQLTDAKRIIDMAEEEISLLEDDLVSAKKRFRKAAFEYLRIGGTKDLLKTSNDDIQCPSCTSKNFDGGHLISEELFNGSQLTHAFLLVPLRLFKCNDCQQEWIEN